MSLGLTTLDHLSSFVTYPAWLPPAMGPLHDLVTWYKITFAGWWASCTVGLPRQRKSYQSAWICLCFGSPTAQLAHQQMWFCTMWPDHAKGLFFYCLVYYLGWSPSCPIICTVYKTPRISPHQVQWLLFNHVSTIVTCSSLNLPWFHCTVPSWGHPTQRAKC